MKLNYLFLNPKLYIKNNNCNSIEFEEGIKIDIELINKAPVGIDTPNDIDILMNELKLGDKIWIIKKR